MESRNVSGEGHLKGKIPPLGRSEYERSRINFASVSVVKKMTAISNSLNRTKLYEDIFYI